MRNWATPRLCFCLSLVAVLSWAPSVQAWGRRGHALIASTAAYVLASEAKFLKGRSFDLGYYANVPDFFWKEPEVIDQENPEHFMDLEIFYRALNTREGQSLGEIFTPNRNEFFALHPDIPPEAGRAFWRISEINERLSEIAGRLRGDGGASHQKLQAQWLLLAGVLSHYVGDMGMPLHCTENYDGQLSSQKGIHSFFEGTLVDELYPALENQVLSAASKGFAEFHQKSSNKDAFRLALELCEESAARIPQLLALDKKVGRTDLAAAKKAFSALIKRSLIQSTLVTAELWGRHLGWKYNGHNFFIFHSRPQWISPQKPAH